MQFTSAQELAMSMKSHAIKIVGVLLDVDQIVLIISTKENDISTHAPRIWR
jgi:hypothetical protein